MILFDVYNWMFVGTYLFYIVLLFFTLFLLYRTFYHDTLHPSTSVYVWYSVQSNKHVWHRANAYNLIVDSKASVSLSCIRKLSMPVYESSHEPRFLSYFLVSRSWKHENSKRLSIRWPMHHHHLTMDQQKARSKTQVWKKEQWTTVVCGGLLLDLPPLPGHLHLATAAIHTRLIATDPPSHMHWW